MNTLKRQNQRPLPENYEQGLQKKLFITPQNSFIAQNFNISTFLITNKTKFKLKKPFFHNFKKKLEIYRLIKCSKSGLI
jgi:hypothetical protein